ncbi:GNAT family N-acetyltransferase [Marinicella sp. W31]|uniref:GNAT family N-acetyltransferase n=1 Tax=Marinicella sp. W31 TaxID=3023713 RepID=UPI00375775E2
MTILNTDRLLLRPPEARDYDDFVRFFSNQQQAEYVGGVKDAEQCWRLLASYIGHWSMKGYGYMSVEERSSGLFMGCVGLWDSDPWPELEMGYWLMAEAQGQGYAFEAANAVLQLVFNTLGQKTLVSYIAAENHASIQLAERLGARYEQVIELLDFGPHGVYRYSNSA